MRLFPLLGCIRPSDDDERDDTTMKLDVGGYVDAARPDGEESRDYQILDIRERMEEALFRAWRMDRWESL